MQLSSSEIGRLANLGRKLAKAFVIENVVAQIFDTLHAVCKTEEVRIVYPETGNKWIEWTATADSVNVADHRELPRVKSRALVELFDKENPHAGFICIEPSMPKAAQTLALLAPQIWTGMLLHTSLDRAKRSHISENTIVREGLRARDEERRRIARELHDDLGQSMASLKLKLKWTEDRIGNHNGMSEASSELKSARQDLGEMLDKIRDLSHTLYPRILDTLGLVAAVKELAHQSTRHSGVQVGCSTAGDERELPKDIGVALYRCCQEAIGNALKHSGARTISVEIAFKRESVRLTVEDDGKGFDPRALYDSGARIMSSGFWTIRQRMSDLGGAFRLSTAHGQGTVVEMIVPLKSRKADAKRKDKTPRR